MRWISSCCKPLFLKAFSIFAIILLCSPFLDRAMGTMQRGTHESSPVDRVLRSYEQVRINPQEVTRQVRDRGRFQIATSDLQFEVFLEPYDLRAPGYLAEEEVMGGIRNILPRMPARTFRGTVPGLRDSEARFTIRENRVEGVILTPGEWYFAEPLRNFVPSSDPSEMIVYRRSDIRQEALGVCGATLAHRIGEAHELVKPQVLAAGSGIHTAEVATEADYEYVTALGGAQDANASILEILNQVDGVYQTQLSVSLSVIFQHAWSSPEDPYSVTSASSMLNEFRNYWNANFYGVAFDLAHMWTGKDLDGNTIGIAYLSVVCQARTYSYGISQRFVSTPGRFILTAHEIGHNFGATHPDQVEPPQTDCGNTIMNSSIGTGFTFCPFSASQIESHIVSSSTCLTTGAAAPSNLTAMAVSSSQINLSWQDNSADETGFVVERKNGAGGIWETAGTTAPNAAGYNDTNLAGNTTYFYRVQATATEGDSSFSNEASATTLPASGPTITGMLPSSGTVGTVVTITGTNLNGAIGIRFNVTEAFVFTVISPVQIQVVVPAGATTGKISVTTPSGTAMSQSNFIVDQGSNRCDLNNDGMANVLDVQLLINAILNIPGSPPDSDINGDGTTNVLDLQVIINVILGLCGCPG